jgi:hypothetical protein
MFEKADEPSSDIEESAALALKLIAVRKIERKVQKGVQRLRELVFRKES